MTDRRALMLSAGMSLPPGPPMSVRTQPGFIDDTGDAALREVDREAFHHHVHCRLGTAIRVGAAGSVVFDRSHAARDRDNPFEAALRDVLDERLGDPHGSQRIGVEHLRPGGVVETANPLVAWTADACVVQQEIDRLAIQFGCGRPDARRVRDVHFEDANAPTAFGGEPLQLFGGARRPAGREDPPAIGGVLARELEAETAVRTGDEDGGQRITRLVTSTAHHRADRRGVAIVSTAHGGRYALRLEARKVLAPGKDEPLRCCPSSRRVHSFS